jgi:hypothetical protein
MYKKTLLLTLEREVDPDGALILSDRSALGQPKVGIDLYNGGCLQKS